MNKRLFRDFLQGFKFTTALVTNVFINWHIQCTPEPTPRLQAGKTTPGTTIYYNPMRA